MKIADELKDSFLEDIEVLASIWCELSTDMQLFLCRALAGSKDDKDFKEAVEELAFGIHNVNAARETLEDMIDEE